MRQENAILYGTLREVGVNWSSIGDSVEDSVIAVICPPSTHYCEAFEYLQCDTRRTITTILILHILHYFIECLASHTSTRFEGFDFEGLSVDGGLAGAKSRTGSPQLQNPPRKLGDFFFDQATTDN